MAKTIVSKILRMDDLLSSLLILWGESVMPYPLPSSWALYAALSETPCPPTVTGLLVSSPFLEYQFHFLFPVKSKQAEYTLLSWYLKFKIHENLFAKMNKVYIPDVLHKMIHEYMNNQ